MTGPEIFTKCLPKPPRLSPGRGGSPEVTWQDVILSVQGIDKKYWGFIRYIYFDDPQGRHEFYAGLFEEAMARPDVQQWKKHNRNKKLKNQIDKMVELAMFEWKNHRRWEGDRITEADRAKAMGVSLTTWKKWYKQIYSNIAAIPAYWEGDFLATASRRLEH